MIELEQAFEEPLFQIVIDRPECITSLPKGLYEKFHAYMLQEEMYEEIPKLEGIKDKISDETLDEMLDDLDWNDISEL